jgi:hypothetical protein
MLRRRPAYKSICRLKCNRGLPCDTCTRRNKSSLCNYAANASRAKPSSSKPRDVRDRLNTLESLVSSFLSGDTVIQPGLLTGSEPATEDGQAIISPLEQYSIAIPAKQSLALSSPSRGDIAFAPETPHLQETGDGQVNYIDPSHWLSILDDIKEVRDHLSVSNQPVSQNGAGFAAHGGVPDASFLFGSTQNSSLGEILSSLPSQPICDMLVSWYFNSSFMVLGKIESSSTNRTKPLTRNLRRDCTSGQISK